MRPDGIPFEGVAPLDGAALVLCSNPNPVFCDGFESGSTGAWDCTVPGNCVEDPTGPLYTGKELESLTGLYDYGARQYDPRIGRFTTPDPGPWQLENPQTFNRYAYALNSPYKYVDPDGEVAVVAVVVGLAAVGFLAAEPANAPSPGDTLLAGSNDNGLGAMAVAASVSLGLDKAASAALGATRAVLSRLGAAGGKAAKSVQFAQRGVSATFRHGEFAGNTIDDVVAGLRSGRIHPDQLPIKTITREGTEFTLNNRSLLALRKAGVEPTRIIDVSGQEFFERQLTSRLQELGSNVASDFVPTVRGGN